MSVEHIKGDWIWSVLLFYIYSAAVQTMPPPRPGERWYTWLYGFLQVLGANLKDIFAAKAEQFVTTTTIRDSGDTRVIQKTEQLEKKD